MIVRLFIAGLVLISTFTLNPMDVAEAGVLLPVARMNLIANVKYHYAFATADTGAFSAWSFNVGIAPGTF